jgi:hypothetical protein
VLTTRQFTWLYAGLTVLFLAIIAFGAIVVPLQLEKAVTQQCLTRDWPADKAVATEAWCKGNGYQVGRG